MIARFAKVFVVLAVLMLALDAVWIGLVMRGPYMSDLRSILLRQGESLTPRWLPVALVYVLLPLGILAFVRPLAIDASLPVAFGWGALFGLVVYGVYDLTNYGIVAAWTLRVTCADIGWGCFLCGVATVVLRWMTQR